MPAPPLWVWMLVDCQNQPHPEFLSSWPNQSSLTLWSSRSAATSYASRSTSSDLVYRAVWSTGALHVKAVTRGGGNVGDAELEVVSAIAADLLDIGELDIVVQASNGPIWALSHSSVTPASSSSSSTSPFRSISIINVGAAASPVAPSTQPRRRLLCRWSSRCPNVPQLTVVPDVLCTLANPHVAQAALAFVNTQDQLVLLFRIVGMPIPSTLQWSPSYATRALVDEHSSTTHRSVLPFPILLADVNEDCAAELLLAVRDTQRQRCEVRMFSQSGMTAPAATSPSSVFVSSLLLQQLAEDAGERYGETFTFADMSGDGLPELLLSVQLANSTACCSAADTTDVTETCTPYHAIRVFYPIRALGVGGGPSCGPPESSDERHLAYTVTQRELFVLKGGVVWSGTVE
ncbi:hypothetical protein, conserved [Leishmania shawi]|uniref:Uncharacterized protein n=1 Tax=Leishmania shawi TaxID=5680 RepID=A0ABR3E366_9TRYP